jgi:P-type conjugative transfer protein TrbJ
MTLFYRLRQPLAGLLVLSLSVLPPPASALFGVGDIVYDPANFGQNVLTAMRALQSNVNEAQQIQNQLQQIAMEARNLAALPQSVWSNIQADLNQLQQLAQSSGAISYALQNLSAQFHQIYPGYQAPADYQQQYQQWTNNSLERIGKALDAATQQSKQFEQESATTQSLADLSKAAEGQMQALQAGNMIALQMVNRLQELQHLQVLEMQAQNLYMAQQIQDKAAQDAKIKQWLDSDIGYKSKM